MIRNNPIICLTFFCFTAGAQSFMAVYAFQDVGTGTGIVDPSPTPSVSGLSFASFTAIGVAGNPNASSRFSFSDWPLGSSNGVDTYSLFNGSFSAFKYYETSLTVKPGYTLSLNSVSFAMRRSGTGIRTFCMRSSSDNFSNDLAASTGTNSKLSVIPTNIFFWNYDSVSTSSDQKGSTINFGPDFSAITGSLTFRFYAWNAEATGGTFSIDNVVFEGKVQDSSALFTGIHENEIRVEDRENVQLYPLPAISGKVRVEAGFLIKTITVSDHTGRMLISEHPEMAQSTVELDLDELNAGVYYLRVEGTRNRKLKRLIVSQ